MKSDVRLFYVLCSLFIIFITKINCRFNMIVKKFENCDPAVDYIIKVYATFRISGGKQYADANATSQIALDDNLKSNFIAELLVGERYMEIMKLEEKRTCTILHKFVGEFAYDIERVAQLVPGLCPIPPGRYHIHNYLLNFDKITLKFPFGQIRMTAIVTDKNGIRVACLTADIENKNI